MNPADITLPPVTPTTIASRQVEWPDLAEWRRIDARRGIVGALVMRGAPVSGQLSRAALPPILTELKAA